MGVQMVPEYAQGMDLFHAGMKTGPRPLELDRSMALKICLPVAKALVHLHNNGFIYRDLKPENILVENPRQNQFDAIMLTDMGFVDRCAKGQKKSDFCGTIEYMAPEMMHNKSYGQSVDLWSLGVLMLEVGANYVPALFDSNDKVIEFKEQSIEKGMEGTQRFARFSREKKIRKITAYSPTVFQQDDLLLGLTLDLLRNESSMRPEADEVVSRLKTIIAAEEQAHASVKKRTVTSVSH